MNLKEKLQTDPNNVGIEHPTGWDQLISDLHDALVVTDPEYRVVQTKEKFGGLRFYCNFGISEEGQKLVSAAEAKSETVCQECGKPGKLVSHGWWATLCPKHDEADNDRGYRPFKPRNWQVTNVQKEAP